VGHSEGGWTIAKMYPRLLKLNIKPKGMIFLCGFGMNMKDSLDYQKDQIRISIETMPGFKGWLCRFLRVVKLIEYQAKASMKYLLSTTGDMIRVLWVKVNAKWIREMVQYSVIPDYKVIECDVLAISGGKDVQVPVLEPMARDLLPNASAVRILNIKDMCHVLKIQENQASILNVKSDYKGMADKELAPELIRALNEFLAK
jgi:hypothetical protein